MSLVRRILSHGLLITIVALAVIGYLYRAQLFPDLYQQTSNEAKPRAAATGELRQEPGASVAGVAPGEDEGPSKQALPLPEVSGVERAAPPSAVKTVPGGTDEVSTAAAAEATPTPQSAPAPRSTPAEVPAGMRAPTYPPMAPPAMMAGPRPAVRPPQQPATGPALREATPTPSALEPSAPAKAVPSDTIAATKGTASEPGGAQIGSAEATDVHRLVAQAREAFWRQDYAKAEEDYRAAARQDPENPNPYGELGNVYYAQGKWPEAGKAYLEAATRLLAQGRKSQAMQLHRVIEGLDADSAAELERLLGEAPN